MSETREQQARELLERVKGKHLCVTCKHRRGEHAMDLVGEHFCEHDGGSGPDCNCRNYLGVTVPSYAELVAGLEGVARALAACALEAARPFKEALMVNPFSGGQDGDLCLWCRTNYPSGLMHFEEHFLQEHHLATCELMVVLEKWAALERAAGEGK